MKGFGLYLSRRIPRGGTEKQGAFGADIALPEAARVSWSTRIPGGFGSLSVAIDAADAFSRTLEESGFLLGDPQVSRLSYISVRRGMDIVWEGYVPVRAYDGPYLVGIEAVGYGGYLAKGVYRSSDLTTRSADEMVATALRDAMPLIQLGEVDAFGTSYAPADFDGRTVSQIIDQITNEGTPTGGIMDWAIWEGPTLHLRERRLPEEPDYRADFKRGFTAYREDDDAIRSSLYIEYKTPEGVETETVRNTARSELVDDIGFDFNSVVQGGVLTTVQAESFQRRYLNALAMPTRSARGRFTRDFPLYTRSGVEADHASVRAGQTIQFGDLPVMHIISTDYQLDTDELSLEAGSEWMDHDAILDFLQLYAEGLADRTQPRTGARWE